MPSDPLLQPHERPQSARQAANRDQRQAWARNAVDQLLQWPAEHPDASVEDLGVALGLAGADIVSSPDVGPGQEFGAALGIVAAAVLRLYSVQAQADGAYQRGLAEGRRGIVAEADEAYKRGALNGRELGLRQATEGWEREWGTRYPEGDILKPLPEADARLYAGRYAGTVVTRLVGPWEPAEPAPQGDVPTVPVRTAEDVVEGAAGILGDVRLRCPACGQRATEIHAMGPFPPMFQAGQRMTPTSLTYSPCGCTVQPATGGVVDPAPEEAR